MREKGIIGHKSRSVGSAPKADYAFVDWAQLQTGLFFE